MSPEKRSSSGIAAPVGNMLGNKLLAFAKSRLPVPNKPRQRPRCRAFLKVAPVPFAPLVDTHAFQPPPPYSAYPVDAANFLLVPHNTPEIATPTMAEDGLVRCAATTRPVGLGLDGVENADGGRFDGLGRLSGGFRAGGTHDALREQIRRMLDKHSWRRRTRENGRPTKCHDVFYASVEAQASASCIPTKRVRVRIRRKSTASPTPGPRWGGVRRGTISSELKRAASLERRASLGETARVTPWRV